MSSFGSSTAVCLTGEGPRESFSQASSSRSRLQPRTGHCRWLPRPAYFFRGRRWRLPNHRPAASSCCATPCCRRGHAIQHGRVNTMRAYRWCCQSRRFLLPRRSNLGLAVEPMPWALARGVAGLDRGGGSSDARLATGLLGLGTRLHRRPFCRTGWRNDRPQQNLRHCSQAGGASCAVLPQQPLGQRTARSGLTPQRSIRDPNRASGLTWLARTGAALP